MIKVLLKNHIFLQIHFFAHSTCFANRCEVALWPYRFVPNMGYHNALKVLKKMGLLFYLTVSITTWWLIPLSKWVITPVINGISRVNPLITGVITHLLSGMSHQVVTLSSCSHPNSKHSWGIQTWHYIDPEALASRTRWFWSFHKWFIFLMGIFKMDGLELKILLKWNWFLLKNGT